MMHGAVPPKFNHPFAHSISTSHKDITEDKYRELRRPRKVTFYCNGDRYFKGKKLSITPHRYLTFNDLLNDLTDKLPTGVPLPYGVRQIYTPVAGKRVKDIEELQDGESYVCAGFEPFKSIRYGGETMDRWSMGRPMQYDFQQSLSPNPSMRSGYSYGGFHPGRHLRQTYPRGRYHPGLGPMGAQRGHFLMQSDNIPMKPKVITVVRNGKKPRNNIKILLNRRSCQSFEQLVTDISEAFGPKWKNNKVRCLYTTRGKAVNSVSDFFRSEDVFVAVGNEQLTTGDVQDIIEELYPDGADNQSIMRQWEKNKKKNTKPMYMYTYNDKDSDPREEAKRDSGFEETGSSGDGKGDEIIYDGLTPRSWKSKARKGPYNQNQYGGEYLDDDWMARLERERARASEREREMARRRSQKKLEAERQALEDEKRRRGVVPQKDNEKLKKRQQEKMKERKRREAELQRAKEEGEKAKREEEEREMRAAAKKITKKKSDSEVEQVEIIITKGEKAAKKREKEPEEKQKEKKDKEDEKKNKKAENKTDKNEANNNNNNKVKDDNENKNKENKHKDGVGGGDENANKHKNEEDNKNKENKEKEKKKRTNSKVKKSKLERQISNADHVLEKYEPGKTLGDGNFAIVKQSKMKNTPNEYAMKIIDKSKLKGKEYMVENEIEIMRLCNHPTIVKLYEEYETKDEIYLIMELVKGGDLFDAITQSVKFGEPEAAGMVKDLTDALFYLHSQNIVHRDLKPENLLVHRNKDGTITLKLADFGLAMEVKEPIFTVCGTPTYVAPEILSEIGYGLEIDMWAVGVIMYILLCGFPPFRSPDRNQTELFEYIKAGEYEFLSPYWDSISDSAKDLIERLLIVEKKKRYTAVDVLCHPWIITQGGATKPPDNLTEYRKNLRKDYEAQGKANLESFRSARS